MQNQQLQNEGSNDLGFMDGNSFLSVTSNASKRMSMMGGKRMNDIKRSLNTMIHKGTSARDSMLFLDDPAVMSICSISSISSMSNFDIIAKKKHKL
jgi:hypothetical protein